MAGAAEHPLSIGGYKDQPMKKKMKPALLIFLACVAAGALYLLVFVPPGKDTFAPATDTALAYQARKACDSFVKAAKNQATCVVDKLTRTVTVKGDLSQEKAGQLCRTIVDMVKPYKLFAGRGWTLAVSDTKIRVLPLASCPLL
jgi:hypothetical protein